MMLRRGLLPPRPGAVKMIFKDYLTTALPKRPEEFGRAELVSEWHMLSNDTVGCCAWSGAAHETYLWSAEGSERVRITAHDVLGDYAECTGYVIGDATTDNGTDMQAAAEYRRVHGIRDAYGKRHKIGAYCRVQPDNVEQLLTGTWLFGAIGLGVTIGAEHEKQFAAGEPWDGDPGVNKGGHYVPLVGFKNGYAWVVTWGKLQAVSKAFLESYCDQAIAYLSPDMMHGATSLDGFDLAQLTSDLKLLTA